MFFRLNTYSNLRVHFMNFNSNSQITDSNNPEPDFDYWILYLNHSYFVLFNLRMAFDYSKN